MTIPIVALVGAPNTGKSSLFNLLTGSHQKVGNYPGVTVEKKVGTLHTPKGEMVTVIDLPGTYSLQPQSPDEKIVADVLLRRINIPEFPDIILAIADATNLERTLGIILALKPLNLPMVVVLNMYDIATRLGLKLDFPILERELGCPVVPSVATHHHGISRLLSALDAEVKKMRHASMPPLDAARGTQGSPTPEPSPSEPPSPEAPSPEAPSLEPPSLEMLDQHQRKVDRILKKAILRSSRADILTQHLDRLLLHPLLGGLILVLILFTMFQAVFSWATAPMEWIEGGIEVLGAGIKSQLPDGALRSFLADGLVAGVGSVLVFLPQILILFFFILVLEGSGYMARAAFIMDRVMGLVGLQGKAFVPLLSSFACAIPGMMATRTIKNPRDRLLTIMIAPLMTCSARLPVYALLIGAFIPQQQLMGPINLQGLVLFGLFVIAVLSAMVVAFVLKTLALPGSRAPLLLHLPTYKVPQPRYVVIQLWQRILGFLKRAGTLILPISVGLWVLSTYPRPPEAATEPAINYSLAGRMGHGIEPLVRPLGFDWRIATGLIPGFAAREVMVGALGTVFAVEDAEEVGISQLQTNIRATWGVPTGLALLAWYIFAPQCLATFAVMRRETGSRKWTLLTFAYMLGLAYVAAFVTYRIASTF